METNCPTRILSPQQKKVFFLLFKDLRMKEIASQLSLDRRTIDTYAKLIYKKFGVDGRVGLILKILSENKGLIPLDTAAAPVVRLPEPHCENSQ